MPRFSSDSGPVDRNVQVRLTSEDHAALKAIADAEGLRIAQVIRLLLRWTLRQEEASVSAGEELPMTAAEFIHGLVLREQEEQA